MTIRGKKQVTCSTGEIATTYPEYLLTNHWRTLRELVAQEHNHTCIRCYNLIRKGFHIHHNNYKRLGNEKMSDLTFYCNRCHIILHKKRKDKRSWNKQYSSIFSNKMAEFEEDEIKEVLEFIEKIEKRKQLLGDGSSKNL